MLENNANIVLPLRGFTISHEDDFDERQERWEGRRLLVLNLDGTIRQEIRPPDAMGLQSLCFLGDELWIPDYGESSAAAGPMLAA